MKRIFALSTALSFSILFGVAAVVAAGPLTASARGYRPPLNLVTLQLTTDQWVTTTSAKVTVSVDATADKAGLSKTRKDLMGQLGKISNKAPWHVTSFNRSKDQSGLERVQIMAEARLPEAALTNLRANAKAISKPGQTFRIATIDFSPSPAELEKARAQLRNQLYNKAKLELQRLNSIYPNQHYVVHKIAYRSFSAPMPRPVMSMALIANKVAGRPAPGTAASLAVSNKLQMTAQVVLASKMKGMKGMKGRKAGSNNNKNKAKKRT